MTSGKVVDIALDATFVWYDLLMIGVHATFECGDMQKDLTTLGLDLLGLLLPFVTGLGQADNAVRGGRHIDDLIGVGDNLADDAIGAGDNLGDNIGQHGDDIPIPRCGFNSFSAETPVMTADGLLAISAVETGDYVLAYDEATGAVGFYPVLATWVHEDPVIAYLVIEGELIETTPDHPFYSEDGDWVTAGELEAGDQIRQADGSYGTVETIELVYRLQPMYNLTVAAAHTFFVGEGQWLVHNKCKDAVLGINTYLDSFTSKVGGENYTQWWWTNGGTLISLDDFKRAVNNGSPMDDFFDFPFPTAMDNAPTIHFNLKGIDNGADGIELAIEKGKLSQGYTNTELYLILNNRAWYNKTKFYDRNGNIIKLSFLGN